MTALIGVRPAFTASTGTMNTQGVEIAANQDTAVRRIARAVRVLGSRTRRLAVRLMQFLSTGIHPDAGHVVRPQRTSDPSTNVPATTGTPGRAYARVVHDDRPENERYQHASLIDQALDELRNLVRNPKVLLVLVILVAGLVGLVLIQPSVVQLEGLRAGDCIYVPIPGHDVTGGDRPAGQTTEVVDGLIRAGAERASCDMSHGHEVAAAFVLADPLGAPYPGTGALRDRQGPACEAAFESYVGRPSAGSALELIVVVPDAAAWDKGRRSGACLVGNVDGTFLSGRAGGSAR